MTHEKGRWRVLLASPKAPYLIAALALLLTASSLGNGLLIDDHFHRMVAQDGRGYLGDVRLRLDQFAFFPGDQSFRARAQDLGFWPWWGSHVKIMFLRPVTAATHWLDSTLWPHSSWAAHLHSVLWYGALVLAAGALYRRTLAVPWARGLATLLFALDSGHALPAGWLATRNMTLSVLFGVAALMCQHRSRSDGWRPGRWLGPAALGLSLLSAEYGVGALAYLLAYALVMEQGTWQKRALGMLPYLGVGAAWQLVHRALGYGVANTGLYTDPLHQPTAFAAALVERAPVLLASQLTLPFADVATGLPERFGPALVLASLLLLGLFAWLFRPQLALERSQRWYALGALFAVIPSCTTFTHSRMNLFASIGAAALVAGFAERAVAATTRSLLTRTIAVALVLRHTLLSALLLSVNAAIPKKFANLLLAADRSLPSDPALAKQTLVVVNTPHVFASNFTITMRQHGDDYPGTWPERIRTLGESVQAVQVRRIDLHTLEVEVADGYLGAPLYHIAWTPRDKRPAGFTVELADSRFEVMEATPDGRPLRVRARFAEPLESPHYRWVAWQRDHFSPFALPGVGKSVTLPPTNVTDVLSKLD